MKRVPVTEKRLRQIVKEELAGAAQAPAQGAGIGKLLTDLVTTFEAKMQSQYPADAVKKEAQDLRAQLEAQIRASVAKLKVAAKPS